MVFDTCSETIMNNIYVLLDFSEAFKREFNFAKALLNLAILMGQLKIMITLETDCWKVYLWWERELHPWLDQSNHYPNNLRSFLQLALVPFQIKDCHADWAVFAAKLFSFQRLVSLCISSLWISCKQTMRVECERGKALRVSKYFLREIHNCQNMFIWHAWTRSSTMLLSLTFAWNNDQKEQRNFWNHNWAPA